jgi:methionyl-tRNA formyltransferase
MNSKIDSGDLISMKKRNLSLKGSAQEIYERSSKIIFDMIKEITKMKKIISFEQKGKVTKFKRLNNNGEINTKSNNLNEIFDHIRMLDAKTYDGAFIRKEKLKITFSNVRKIKNMLSSIGIISLND